MRQVLHALNKENQNLKKELGLYKKSYNEKVDEIDAMKGQVKRLQQKINFGIQSMFRKEESGSQISRNNTASDTTGEEVYNKGFKISKIGLRSSGTLKQDTQSTGEDDLQLDYRLEGLNKEQL